MTIHTTTQRAGKRVRTRRSLLLGLGLGVALAGAVALGGTAYEAQAAFAEKIVFSSDRTAGADNPTGDYEVFKMNPDGTGVRQLTFNEADDWGPVLSPDGRKISYETNTTTYSDPEDDWEVYTMSAIDGKGKRNLSNNGSGVDDETPLFSPGGKRIAYESSGIQNSNPQGDDEIYVMDTLDGKGKKNLTNNRGVVYDYDPAFSPAGGRVSYTSDGVQKSNSQGDNEIYTMSVLDGTGKKNLTNNGADAFDSVSNWGVQAR